MANICLACNHNNPEDAKYCNQCGSKLNFNNDTTTNIVGELKSDEIFEAYDDLPVEIKDLESEGFRAALYLIGKNNIFSLEDKKEFILGRRVKSSEEVIDIDFEPFEGYGKGVSRIHAKVTISEDIVTITDLNSSNGTYLNRKRLMPAKSYTLSHGDIVSLGSLILQFHQYN